MKIKKTEAQKIIEARHASYANYPSGFYDETDLLLLSQHYSELIERKKKRGKKKRLSKTR
jgi:hypothetical protein